MKKWLVSVSLFLLVLAGCAQQTKQENEFIVEGTVLHVQDSTILLSKRSDLSQKDLNKTYDDWMSDDYDLMSISNLDGVQVGMIIRVLVEGGMLEIYPIQAKGKSYEVINQIEKIPNDDSELTTTRQEQSYSQQLRHLFPEAEGANQLFHGYGEYGHFQTLNTAQLLGSTFQLLFDGYMMDGRGEGSERVFQLIYEVSDQEVIEHIYNHDPYKQLNNERLLSSIIPDKIILKSPLQLGNSWSETFVYNEKDYIALTEIVGIKTTDKGKMQYETLTTVCGIDGDEGNCYKESRIFTEGSGMTSFSNLFLSNHHEMNDEGLELYLFGYQLSAENISFEK
ncbi:MAG: DUF3221 domain-containing protein [Turicibacter sp.]|nr:DUF3221 domain-containing protein [Turicibacter sp.]